jgi:hypothetical protein
MPSTPMHCSLLYWRVLTSHPSSPSPTFPLFLPSCPPSRSSQPFSLIPFLLPYLVPVLTAEHRMNVMSDDPALQLKATQQFRRLLSIGKNKSHWMCVTGTLHPTAPHYTVRYRTKPLCTIPYDTVPHYTAHLWFILESFVFLWDHCTERTWNCVGTDSTAKGVFVLHGVWIRGCSGWDRG